MLEVCLLLLVTASTAAREFQKPTFVVIMVDDIGYADTMQATLLALLESVSAETPTDIPKMRQRSRQVPKVPQ